MLPAGGPVLPVGDREVGGVELLRQVEHWGRRHVLRPQVKHLVDRVDHRDLCIFQIELRWVERCQTVRCQSNSFVSGT